MSGETNLKTLLEGLSPILDPACYVYASLTQLAFDKAPDLAPLATVREEEGLTVVVPLEKAEAAGLDTASRYRRITLQVHSSLEAVGLTAAVSKVLAEKGIPANMIAGYYHDHILVPDTLAAQALDRLRNL